MNAILLGPQGVGKGTQGGIIAPQLRLARIVTGDLLRAAIRQRSELGKLAQSYMDRGALVPDEVVLDLVIAKLQEVERNEPPLVGALFDGFPRNRTQAENLDAALEKIGERIDRVVNLDAPRAILIERLSTRITCADCGAIYGPARPPRTPGVCDICGSSDLRRRPDDAAEAAIVERLRLYDEQTKPLLDYYRQRGVVREVDGDQAIDQVTGALLEALKPEQESALGLAQE